MLRGKENNADKVVYDIENKVSEMKGDLPEPEEHKAEAQAA